MDKCDTTNTFVLSKVGVSRNVLKLAHNQHQQNGHFSQDFAEFRIKSYAQILNGKIVSICG
jgi:hypothetical protein